LTDVLVACHPPAISGRLPCHFVSRYNGAVLDGNPDGDDVFVFLKFELVVDFSYFVP
jgi:hypothetical protein